MEGALFLEGQPPDFSVLPELLCPPCLESEPGYSPLSVPAGDFGSEPAAGEDSGSSPSATWLVASRCQIAKPSASCRRARSCCPKKSPSAVTQGSPRGSWAGRCARSTASADPRATASPLPWCLSPPTDALNLISLHCSRLGSEPLDPVKPPEAGKVARERSPVTPSKDRGGPQGWRAGVEEPRLTQASESQRGRRRVVRKQPKPRRSCDALDPNFEGVTLHMKLCLCQSCSEGCRLIINPQFSSGKFRKKGGAPLAEECKVGSLEEDGFASTHRHKRCASCKTRKTPLWRDAEDGTPLCNACGIRYKKYRIRCFHCWSIPKHGGKPYPHCSNCGGKLGVVAAQQKPGRRCGNFVNICN